MTTSRVALVSGANRGIGREVCRQLAALGFTTYLGSRDVDRGAAAADALSGDVRAVQLDVTDQGSIDAAVARIDAEHGHLDVLVNNGAAYFDEGRRALDPDFDEVTGAFATNTVGPWRLALAAVPLLRRSAHPRIVNVSSSAARLSTMRANAPAYRVSKTALNAVTRMLADDLAGDGVLVNSVCPGFVATDMGGPAGRPIPEGAAGVVWAATLPDDGPTGEFFRDQAPVDW